MLLKVLAGRQKNFDSRSLVMRDRFNTIKRVTWSLQVIAGDWNCRSNARCSRQSSIMVVYLSDVIDILEKAY